MSTNRFCLRSLNFADVARQMLTVSVNKHDWDAKPPSALSRKKQKDVWVLLAKKVFGDHADIRLGAQKLRDAYIGQLCAEGIHAKDLKAEFFALFPENDVFDPVASSTPIRSSQPRVCICRQPYVEGDMMVQCDTCERWFHLTCVGIEEQNLGRRYTGPCCKRFTARTKLTDPSIAEMVSSVPVDLVLEKLSHVETYQPSFVPHGVTSIEISGEKLSEHEEHKLHSLDNAIVTNDPRNTSLFNGDGTSVVLARTLLTKHSICDTFDDSTHGNGSTTVTADEGSEGNSSKFQRSTVNNNDFIVETDIGGNINQLIDVGPESFSISLTAGEYEHFFVETKGDVLKRNWPCIIAKKIAAFNKFCVLNCTRRSLDPRKNGYMYFCATLQCRHSGRTCYKYNIKGRWKGNAPVFRVTREGDYQHSSNEQFARQIKYRERSALKRKLLTCQASRLSTKINKNADLMAIQQGNRASYPDSNNLRHIRQQGFQEMDFDKDPYRDLERRMDAEEAAGVPFLRAIGSRAFHMLYFFKAQVLVLKALRRLGGVKGHIDATGSLCAGLNGTARDIYVYSIVVKSKLPGKPPLELCGFVSQNHDVNTLSYLMRKFSTFCKKELNLQRGEPVFQRVEIDFSAALLRSSLETFCEESLDNYLNKCWLTVTQAKQLLPCIVHACRSHLSKCMMDQLRKKLPDSEDAVHLRGYISGLLHSRTMASVHKRTNSLFLLLLSKTQHDLLPSYFADCLSPTPHTYAADHGHEWTNFQVRDLKPNRLYTNTPFGQFFYRLRESCAATVQKLDSETLEKNPLYSPSFVSYLVEDILPYVPVITKLMFPGADPAAEDARRFDSSDDTQWAVEYWWFLLKRVEMKSFVWPLKPGRFEENMKLVLVGRTKAFIADMLLCGKDWTACSKKRNVNQAHKDLNAALGVMQPVFDQRDFEEATRDLDTTVAEAEKRKIHQKLPAAFSHANKQERAEGSQSFRNCNLTGSNDQAEEYSMANRSKDVEIKGQHDKVRIVLGEGYVAHSTPKRKKLVLPRGRQQKVEQRSFEERERWLPKGGSQLLLRKTASVYEAHDLVRLFWANKVLITDFYDLLMTCTIDNILNALNIIYHLDNSVREFLDQFPHFTNIIRLLNSGHQNLAKALFIEHFVKNKNGAPKPRSPYSCWGDLYEWEGSAMRNITGDVTNTRTCEEHGVVEQVNDNFGKWCADRGLDFLLDRLRRSGIKKCQKPSCVIRSELTFLNNYAPPLLYFQVASVDPQSEKHLLDRVSILGHQYRKFSRTLHKPGHFVGNYFYDNKWFNYDGMRIVDTPGFNDHDGFQSVLYVKQQ